MTKQEAEAIACLHEKIDALQDEVEVLRKVDRQIKALDTKINKLAEAVHGVLGLIDSHKRTKE